MMNKKNLNQIKKVIAIAIMILMLIIPSVTNATYSSMSQTGFSIQSDLYQLPLMDIVKQRYDSISQYNSFLEDLRSFMQGMDTTITTDKAKIQIIDKVEELRKTYSDSPAVSNISSQILNRTIISNNTSTSDLVGTITTLQESFINAPNTALKSLTPDKVVDITAITGPAELGENFRVKLSANIYYANIDKKGEPTSDRWALLIQGFQMDGQTMADSVGQMYIQQGYNVLAMDIRGFGNSEGSVGMGYVESLDAWDWLTFLNETYPNKCNQIIVHGISLGGATTLFLSGLEMNGKTLKDQNVIGLVDDCGYTSMMGIIDDLLGSISDVELVSKILGILDKESLMDVIGEEKIKEYLIEKVDTGLTEETFDTCQNALDSLAKCELPILIIHGTEDFIVPFENSTDVYNTVMQNDKIPYVQRFVAEGESHAFITIGIKYNVYEGHVKNFVEQAEKIANGSKIDKVSNYQQEEERKTSLIDSFVKILGLLKNMLK